MHKCQMHKCQIQHHQMLRCQMHKQMPNAKCTTVKYQMCKKRKSESTHPKLCFDSWVQHLPHHGCVCNRSIYLHSNHGRNHNKQQSNKNENFQHLSLQIQQKQSKKTKLFNFFSLQIQQRKSLRGCVNWWLGGLNGGKQSW